MGSASPRLDLDWVPPAAFWRRFRYPKRRRTVLAAKRIVKRHPPLKKKQPTKEGERERSEERRLEVNCGDG